MTIKIDKIPPRMNHEKIEIKELNSNLFDSKNIPVRILASLLTAKQKADFISDEDFKTIQQIKKKYFADIDPTEKQYSQKIYHRLMTEKRFKKIPTERKTAKNNTACDYIIQLA